MEEEINYNIMRYELDANGYVLKVFFGCASGACTGYTGEIPSGYSSLEDWNENANIRAYKVIDGNLILDSNRKKELEALCNQEAEDNRHVTKGELEKAIANIEEDGGEINVSNSKELESILPNRSASGNIILLDDASSLNVPYFKLTSDTTIKNEITIISSTPNIMPNEAITKTENGLTLTVNEDRSISVSGTPTGSGTLTIAGSISNRNPLITFKANEPYFLAELPSGYEWAFYYYDGTDREQVYLGSGGVIELLEDKQVTHIELVWTAIEPIITESEEELLIESGAKLMLEGEEVTTDTTIYPMLNVGDTALEYQKHEENKTTINLGSNSLTENNSVVYENNACKIGSSYLTIDNIFHTYNPNTVIYSLENVHLDVDYKKSSFDYVTATGSNGTLVLKNTADGLGSIRKLTLENISAGDIYTLISSNGDEEIEEYQLDLSEYTGKVTIEIEEGKTSIIQSDEVIGTLDNIYVRTYSPTTYLNVDGLCNMTCEYMLESDFSIYCTRVEKDASIKIVEDQIALEVKRASEAEGELSSKITVEADRITQEVKRAKEYEEELYSLIEVEADKISQIVRSVGEDGEVTSASIIQAINDDTSSIQISADKIDIQGKNLPTISNEDGSCKIQSQDILSASGHNAIQHTADVHQFQYYSDKENSDFRVITRNFHFLGNGEFRVLGDFYLNGELFDGTAKFG